MSSTWRWSQRSTENQRAKAAGECEEAKFQLKAKSKTEIQVVFSLEAQRCRDREANTKANTIFHFEHSRGLS
jgi:hypothetical protein